MTPTKVEKAFDCLAYKDRVQAEIYQEIKDMTHEQEIAYFRRATETGPLADWWKRARGAQASAAVGRGAEKVARHS